MTQIQDTNLLTADIGDAQQQPIDGADTAATTDGKPHGLPDKFWDAKTGTVRVDALVKSYVALEKKLATMVDLPNDDDSRKKFLRAAGVPETADGYQISIRDELFEPDLELNQRLHAKGFTPEQVQEVYDLAVEKMVPMILDLAAEFQAERELERLVSHFGGEDQWREVSRQMLTFGQKNLPPAVLEGLSGSYEGVMALYKMMQNDEPNVSGNGTPAAKNSEQDLQSMMRDPKYWRDKDPAFIAKVTEGFKQIYG